MPNYVSNIVKMKGITALPLFSLDRDGVEMFDFNTIIPMPDSLKLEAGSLEDIAIEAMTRKLEKKKHGLQLTLFKHRMTDEDFERRLSAIGRPAGELEELGLQYISNKVKYGATTWYDWCIDNWDTKWNAYSYSVIDEDTIKFDTAWSCPEKVIIRLSGMYPELELEHWWADEDTGCNTGHAKYAKGVLVEGGYFENMSSDAYETYVFCRGESECIYVDENQVWHRRDCETCHGCD